MMMKRAGNGPRNTSHHSFVITCLGCRCIMCSVIWLESGLWYAKGNCASLFRECPHGVWEWIWPAADSQSVQHPESQLEQQQQRKQRHRFSTRNRRNNEEHPGYDNTNTGVLWSGRVGVCSNHIWQQEQLLLKKHFKYSSSDVLNFYVIRLYWWHALIFVWRWDNTGVVEF